MTTEMPPTEMPTADMRAQSSDRPTDRPPLNPVALRAEIQQTRSDLADTVQALADKLDVKAQIGSAVSQARGKANDRAARARDAVTGTVAGTTDRVRARLSRRHDTLGEHSTSAVDPSGRMDVSPGDRTRTMRVQAIVAAGAAGLGVLVVALWAVRRRRSS